MRATLVALAESVSQPFKRAQTGLFQGKTKLTGNNKPFSLHKTRRTWLPNVQHKRFPSIIGEGPEGLVRVKLTTRALRTIKKTGGLDAYLKTTPANVLGEEGMRLRMRMLEQERLNQGLKLPSYELQTEAEYNSTRGAGASINQLRAKVARSLGKEGLASAEETIQYITQKRQAKQLAASTS